MFKRLSRRSRLTLLAVFNLVCWLGVTVSVGVLVSDGVDLGVETLIRQRQATVVAVWEQVSQKPSETEARPATTAQAPLPAKTEAATRDLATGTVGPAETAPPPTPRSQATPTAIWPSAPTPPPSSSEATPQAEQPLISSPLLMADPEITSLVGLNTEMRRSAPGRAVQIRYQEAALNGEIAALLENNPELPYRNVHVDLKRDGVIVTGDATVLGFQVSTEANGTVHAQECLPQMEIETISIAGVLTPGFVKDQIKEMILEAMAWYPADYPLCVEQIVLEETRATVYGYRR
jgi:hypothetical protein